MLGSSLDIPSAVSLIQHAFLHILDRCSFLIVPRRLPPDLKKTEWRKNTEWKLKMKTAPFYIP